MGKLPSHLLSVNSYHYPRGGAEAVYFNHAALLEERGWTNSFYSMHHPKNIDCVDSQYFAEEVDLGGPASPAKRLLQASRVIYSFEARRKIGKLLNSRRIDIAHVHNIYHHQSPSIFAELKQRSIPIVLTAHDLKIACPAYKMMNSHGICERCKGGKVWNVLAHRCIKSSLPLSGLVMLESAFHKAAGLYSKSLDRVIAPSAFYRDKLLEWGWSPSQVVHIPNFINTESIEHTSPGGYFFYFGRLSPEKGIATMIRASARSGLTIKIAGTGPEEGYLRALATQLHAPVDFLGFRSGEDLWHLVSGARAVVLPSEWYENGPMSAIEALARGKPLIGARIGGIPELVIEGATGWTFTAGDVDDLARTLDMVATLSDTIISEMGETTRSLVKNQYSAKSYYSAISALYGELGVF